MHSLEAWTARLDGKPLSFLTDQQKFRGLNGPNYDLAIDALVKKKRAAEEPLPPARKVKRSVVVREEEDDGEYVIEHVQSGPKGQTVRVKVPRALHAG